MEVLNRDDVRKKLKELGITSASVSLDQLKLLNEFIDSELSSSGIFRGTAKMQKPRDPHFLEMGCDVWCGREAVSFNRDGFIGFAGWADDKNIQPILSGVIKWADKIKESE